MSDKYSQYAKLNAKDKDGVHKYDIWNLHPAYQDKNRVLSGLRIAFLTGLGMLIATYVYLTTHNFLLAVGLTVFMVIAFCAVFYDSFFRLQGLIRRSYAVQPFKDLKFWQISSSLDALYYTNTKDMVTVGLRIVRIEQLPENMIHPNYTRFLKDLSTWTARTDFSYQIIYSALADGTFKGDIYYTTMSSFRGAVTVTKVERLYSRLLEKETSLYSQFPANFHHTKVKVLEGSQLLRAFRSRILHKEVQTKQAVEKSPFPKRNCAHNILKASFLFFLFIAINGFFMLVSLPIYLVFILNCFILGAIIALWWRKLLAAFSKRKVFSLPEIEEVYPFSGIQFFYYPRVPDTYFAYAQEQELIGIKMFNVQAMVPPVYASLSKFFLGLNDYKMPFTYTAICDPQSYRQFDTECVKNKGFLKDEESLRIVKYYNTDLKRENWLAQRGGMWKFTMLFSTSHSVLTSNPSLEDVESIERVLYSSTIRLDQISSSFFNNFLRGKLRKRRLLAGVQCELLKNPIIRLSGSHLHYVWAQGVLLYYLIQIPNELKRVIPSRIAAEFNTPKYLDNKIVIGNTFNTENLKEESPAGFSHDQLRSLLITSGTNQNQELIAMKIVAELVKQDKPCVVFDFSGNWAKLPSYFRDTKHLNKILFFKLRKAFTLDPFKSEILYENDNISFLEYMFDSFALCFQKKERTLEAFKNTVRKQPEIDIDMLVSTVTNQQEFKRNEEFGSLIALLQKFSKNDLMFFQTSSLSEDDKIRTHHFIKNNKTVIVDLSASSDSQLKCFCIFLMVSKFVHYVKTHQDYVPKFVVVPHLDLVFDGKYIDTNKTINYEVIDKFFSPLQQNRFGLIGLCKHIRYLHPNAFNYFENIVAASTKNNKDIAVITGLMNLNELHGTGYYDNRRNETFQIHFLRNLKSNEAILKRADVYQPFPVVIHAHDIKESALMDYHQIVRYMESLGYDLKYTEKQILRNAKKTIFEKDLGDQKMFSSEIKKFLKDMRTVDKVGGLYERTVKEKLLELLWPKIKEQLKFDKSKAREVRDVVFELLKKHQYLVESHPRAAGGGETTRIGYSVGPQFEKAEQDEFKAQEDIISKQNERLREALRQNYISSLGHDHFQYYQHLEKKDYGKCLEIYKYYTLKFFRDAYKSYAKDFKGVVFKSHVRELIEKFSRLEGFPYKAPEMLQMVRKADQVKLDDSPLHRNYYQLYDEMLEFYFQIEDFLEHNQEGEEI